MGYADEVIDDLKKIKGRLTKLSDRDAITVAIDLIKSLKQEKDELEKLVKLTSDARDLALREIEVMNCHIRR